MKESRNVNTVNSGRNPPATFHSLSHEILRCATAGTPKTSFLRQVSEILTQFWRCDAVELRVKEGEFSFLCEATRDPSGKVSFEITSGACHEETEVSPASAASVVATGDGKSCAIVSLRIANDSVGFFAAYEKIPTRLHQDADETP